MTEIIVSIICAIAGSNGIWLIISNYMSKRDINRSMLIGLGHDRIIFLGKQYIDRGSITMDEYENLVEYLYKPYEMLGGNGSAKRIIEEVKKLPIQG